MSCTKKDDREDCVKPSLGRKTLSMGFRVKRWYMKRTGCSKLNRAGTHGRFEDDVAKDNILERCREKAACKGDFGVCERFIFLFA